MNLSTSKIFIIFCILLFGSGSSFCQNPGDSLIGKLKSSGDETDRLDILIEIARYYQTKNPDKSFQYLKEAVQLSKDAGYKKDKLEIYCLLANYYWSKTEHDNFRRYIDSVYILSKEIDSPLGMAKYHYLNGLYWIDQDSLVRAKNELQVSGEIFKNLENYEGIADSYFRRGIIYWRNHKYDSALNHYSQSLGLYKRINNKRK